MVSFDEWCEVEEETVNGHSLNTLLMPEDRFTVACELVAAVVPEHFASPERISHILDRLGKPKAAAYLREKLPRTPSARSGDLGEILATQYIDERTEYTTPINRLRWKDHREMAMRGDDVIGIAFPEGDTPIKFIKTEVKSRAKLSTAVVQEARLGLDYCDGLPSPHALTFISDRLHEMGQDGLADHIECAQLQDGITEEQVQHLFFTFCGNAPGAFLNAGLERYAGRIRQNAVGLRIVEHQEFIRLVFEKVVANYES